MAESDERQPGHLDGDESLSLYGMDPEDALRKALGMPPPKAKIDQESADRLVHAFSEFCALGELNTTCDVCGSLITFERVTDQVHKSDCHCGKYRDTFRGL